MAIPWSANEQIGPLFERGFEPRLRLVGYLPGNFSYGFNYSSGDYNITFYTIPEPSTVTLLLLGSGAMGLFLARRRRACLA